MKWLRMMFGTPKPVERLAKKYVKPVGDLLEVKNNILDSVENVLDTVSVKNRIYHAITDDTVEDAKKKYHKGDHIATIRSFYSHHGIYDGDGMVYEYQEGKIMLRTLEDFADDDDLYVVSESSPYTPDEIIKRAFIRYDKKKENYNLLWNNCENFATWCRCGGELPCIMDTRIWTIF